MERYDISDGGRLAEMVSSAESGIEVEITRNGNVVAKILPARSAGQDFLDRLANFHRKLPSELTGGDAAAEVRAMRDEEW